MRGLQERLEAAVLRLLRPLATVRLSVRAFLLVVALPAVLVATVGVPTPRRALLEPRVLDYHQALEAAVNGKGSRPLEVLSAFFGESMRGSPKAGYVADLAQLLEGTILAVGPPRVWFEREGHQRRLIGKATATLRSTSADGRSATTCHTTLWAWQRPSAAGPEDWFIISASTREDFRRC